MIKTQKEIEKQEAFKLFDSLFGYHLKYTQEEINLRKSIKKNKILLKQNLNKQEYIKVHNNLINDLITLNSIALAKCKKCKQLLKN